MRRDPSVPSVDDLCVGSVVCALKRSSSPTGCYDLATRTTLSVFVTDRCVSYSFVAFFADHTFSTQSFMGRIAATF